MNTKTDIQANLSNLRKYNTFQSLNRLKMKTFTKISLLILFITLMANTTSSAYTKPVSVVYKSNLLAKAEENFGNAKYKMALNFYVKLLKLDQFDVNANYKAGLCSFNIPNSNTDAINYLKRASLSKDTLPEVLYYLGTVYQLEERFDEAYQTFEVFMNFIKTNKNGRELRGDVMLRMGMCNSAAELIKKNIPVEFKNFKDLNSAYDDCSANMDKLNNTLYFSSKRKGNSGGWMDEDGSYADDIYTLTPNAAGVKNATVKAKKGPARLNSVFADRILSISSDGASMLISREGDIYFSELTKKLWSEPIKMNANINTKSDENAANFSEDGNTIYFSSNRKGGLGGMDIYKSEKDASGEWGAAINLGSTINTAYNEDYPFYHEGGRTLYFSSKREDCIGGYDIFKVSKDLLGWKKPENMGYPLNTTADEIFFSLDESGNHGFYSSARKGGAGNLDVYELFFPFTTNEVAELGDRNAEKLEK